MKSVLLILLVAACSACGPSRNSVTPRLALRITAGPSLEASVSFEQLTQQRSESERNMGKWASQKKHGTARQHGTMAGPAAAEFSIGVAANPQTLITRLVAQPSGATQWAVRAIRLSNGIATTGSATSSPTDNATTNVSGETFRIQTAWFNAAGVRVSDFTTIGNVVAP